MDKEMKLISITIWCPNLKKDVIISRDDLSLVGWEWQSDYARDKGVDLYIWKCECGKSHEVGI